MNHPTRRTFLLGTAGLAALALSGCATPSTKGGGASPSASARTAVTSGSNPFGVAATAPLEVVIFKGGFGDDYAKFVEAMYNKAFPDAVIKHQGIQKIQETLQSRFVAGNPPDVIDNSGGSALNLATLKESGQLLDLKALLEAPSIDNPSVKVKDTLLAGVVEAGTLNGDFVSLNYAFTVYGFWFNQALFDEKGWEVPTTWDELMTIGGIIKAAGMAPFTYQGKFPSYFVDPLMQMIGKAGGLQAVIDIDNLKADAWRTDKVKACVGAIEQLVKAGFMLEGSEGLSHTEAQQAMIDGKAAFIPSGSWLENEMKSTLPAGFSMAVMPTPSVSADDALPTTAIEASSSEAFIVPAQGKNTAGGLEFLRLMLSNEAATKFSQLTGSLTTVVGAGESVNTSPALTSSRKAVAAAGKDIIGFRFAGWYGDMYNSVSTAMGELLAGRITSAEFIDRSQEAADKTASDPDVVKYTR